MITYLLLFIGALGMVFAFNTHDLIGVLIFSAFNSFVSYFYGSKS